MSSAISAIDESVLKTEFNEKRVRVLNENDSKNYLKHQIDESDNAASKRVPRFSSKSPFFTYLLKDKEEEIYFEIMVKIIPSNMSNYFLSYFKYSLEPTTIAMECEDKTFMEELKDTEAVKFLETIEKFPGRVAFELSTIYDAYYSYFYSYLKKLRNNYNLSYESHYKKFLHGFLIAVGFTFMKHCQLISEYRIIIDFHKYYEFSALSMYVDFIVIEKKFLNENFNNFDKSQPYNICIFEVADGLFSEESLELKFQQVLIYVLSFYMQFKLIPGVAMIIVIYREIWCFIKIKLTQEMVNDFYLLKKREQHDVKKKLMLKDLNLNLLSQMKKRSF